jgi:hypothetical protein
MLSRYAFQVLHILFISDQGCAGVTVLGCAANGIAWAPSPDHHVKLGLLLF